MVVDTVHHLAYLKLPKYTHEEGSCPKFKEGTTLHTSPKVKGSSKVARKLARAAIQKGGPHMSAKPLLPTVEPKPVTGQRSQAPRVMTPPRQGAPGLSPHPKGTHKSKPGVSQQPKGTRRSKRGHTAI
jgi:hypothetical protein